MNRTRGCRYPLSTCLLSGCLMLVGCAARSVPSEDPSVTNLRKIGQAYELASDLRHRPPHDANDLRRFFKELGVRGDPDQVLRSPRDGQPYVILFGAALDAKGSQTILAFEQQGAEGRRYVLTLARGVKLLTQGEFDRATLAQGYAPKKDQLPTTRRERSGANRGKETP